MFIKILMKKVNLYHQSREREVHQPSNYIPLLSHHRKDSAEGFTNFQTYPHNEFDREEHENLSEVYNQDGSICPSIEHNMVDFDECLENLSSEIKIKTSALKKAEEFIRILEENLEESRNKVRNTEAKLRESEEQIMDLKAEISCLKETTVRKKEDTGKKSITKTVITDKNIPSQPQQQPLKLISAQIFSEFTESYYELVNHLQGWVQNQIESMNEAEFFSKVQINEQQVQDLLYEYPQINSSISNEHQVLDESCIPFESQKFIQDYHEQYEKIIQMHAEHSHKIYLLLCQCVNKMNQITESIENFTPTPDAYSPRTIVPPELFRVIVRQVSQIFKKKNKALERQNMELKAILDSLISWIRKNSSMQSIPSAQLRAVRDFQPK